MQKTLQCGDANAMVMCSLLLQPNTWNIQTQIYGNVKLNSIILIRKKDVQDDLLRRILKQI